ncbi:MAG TPA: 50S ribosomal protein L23 [Syntrophales bacterium]|nr:50S ribosomal protein L23 [Syntrophobacterales bacterium]HQL91008.1 50S ribosomal protein L23 [Syntrophales bacterium]
MELHQIIRRPLVTEKSTLLREGNQYIFEVDPRANKIEIGKAVEKLFKVKVIGVRTQNLLGKKKRYGRLMGKKSDWKKAVVTVAPGSTIEIFDKV